MNLMKIEHRFSILGEYKSIHSADSIVIRDNEHNSQGDLFNTEKLSGKYMIAGTDYEIVSADLGLNDLYNIKLGDLYLDSNNNFSPKSDITLQMHADKMYIKYGEYGYIGIGPDDGSEEQDLVCVSDFGLNCVYLEVTPTKSVFKFKLNSKDFLCEFLKPSYRVFNSYDGLSSLIQFYAF
ncbi:hypothetical protein AYI69_g3472 [Smittium culicis]|uniref:Uncharacterized protein n=1 Tax=Smittium culicis TaxID=133412 RepID=A0A1R1X6E0_9FUNG|nr:hypothetical protein AYI69_g10336 [Smittium culicis]OMJ27105.1 hypothetical protein AYI69_g3472 [Smittium culicis]